MKRLFVTGTDTEVGKTHVACHLIRQLVAEGHRVAGFKPVASGCRHTGEGLRNADALALMAAANVDLEYAQVNPYAFEPAIAPHVAADRAGERIDPERIGRIAAGIRADYLVIEGAGGWCVPIADGIMLADLARPLTDEIVLVVGLRLGCINHALLSEQQIRRDGFRLAGWIANTLAPEMPALSENIAALKARMSSPLLEILPFDPEKRYANR